MNSDIWILAATEQGHWRPGIGDPTAVGWFTVAAYLSAAFGCGLNWLAERRAGRRRAGQASPTVWLVMSGLMLFLGVNKQLDLQTLLGSIGREISRSQGWYAQRRVFQVLFIAGIAATGLVLLAALCWTVRRQWKQCILPLIGTVFLFVFVLTRASSFHHVDVLLRSEVQGIRWNWILELAGIAAVGLGALTAWRDRGRCSDINSGESQASSEEPFGARSYTFERGILVPRERPRAPRDRRR
jgi:hypothetical protein